MFGKKKKKNEEFNDGFYHLQKRLLSQNCVYSIAIGRRGPGKTFSALEYILERWKENNNFQFGYIRRWAEDLRPENARELFANLVQNGLIEKYTDGKFNSVKYNAGAWYLSYYDLETEKETISQKPIGYKFSLSQQIHKKSVAYPYIDVIIFDEFMATPEDGGYLPNEFNVFRNLLSTIIRRRQGVKIIMLGNTVDLYCPYFDELGIDILDMKPGDLRVFEFGEKNTPTVAVEYTNRLEEGEKENEAGYYLNFGEGKASTKLILEGDWDFGLYPHLPVEYNRDDIKFMYFILFRNNIYQANIIKKDGETFTFIHEKSTPLKNIDEDLIYSLTPSYKRNYIVRIDRPCDRLTKFIWEQFSQNRVFYSTNKVGNAIDNYIMCCQQLK